MRSTSAAPRDRDGCRAKFDFKDTVLFVKGELSSLLFWSFISVLRSGSHILPRRSRPGQAHAAHRRSAILLFILSLCLPTGALVGRRMPGSARDSVGVCMTDDLELLIAEMARHQAHHHHCRRTTITAHWPKQHGRFARWLPRHARSIALPPRRTATTIKASVVGCSKTTLDAEYIIMIGGDLRVPRLDSCWMSGWMAIYSRVRCWYGSRSWLERMRVGERHGGSLGIPPICAGLVDRSLGWVPNASVRMSKHRLRRASPKSKPTNSRTLQPASTSDGESVLQ